VENEKPDIVLVTESWCNEGTTNAFLSIDGYELQTDLRMDRADTAMGRGGGLLVYTRTGLQILCNNDKVNFLQSCSFKVYDFTVYLVYRSPNAPPEAMKNLTELIWSADKNSIIVGDFNLPDIDWKTGVASPRTEAFMDAVDDKHMTQMVDFVTHLRGGCLDLVLTDMPERVREVSEAGRLGKSDHEMIRIVLEAGRNQRTTRRVRNWRKANWSNMRKEIGEVKWSKELKELSVQDMWRKFTEKMNETTERNVPWREVHARGRAAWMTREIMRAIRRKKRLWRKVKGGEVTEEYREADKKVKRLIRNSKRRFEKKLAEGNGNNNRPFFAYIKKKTKSKSSVGPLKNKGEVVAEDQDMAELLNEFFSSVFTREDTRDIPKAEETGAEEMGDVIFTEKKVQEKIKKLRESAAAGPDGIGPKILQEMCREISPALCMIFGKSYECGEVPGDWKDANVTPIFKKGAKSDPGNYRPVSLTSVCCKLMESIIRDAMMAHLLEGNLIKDSQHGFMPGRSCGSNLLEFLEKVTKVLDEGQPFDAIFLDFAKAFDKVPREKLLEKLRAHGIRRKTLQWIRQWLSGRRQRVFLNGKYSKWSEVLSGVPQGSVLGPILFLIFINDLDSVVEEVDIVRKFADDTKMGHRVDNMEGRERLQEAINKLVEWSVKWGMEFNIKKCKVMHFGHNNPVHRYSMGGVELGVTEEERDIGVSVQKNLRPSAQCAKAARTASTVLSQLSRSFHFRDRHVFVRLYKQYVRPHLEFATAAWSPWTAADKECLEKVQKRAVKMVSGLKSTEYEEKLKELGMTTLEERRHQIDMQQTHKILHGVDRVSKETWFTMASDSQRETRQGTNPWNIKPQTARLEIRRNFFSNRVVNGWNSIPREIQEKEKPKDFKMAYEKHRSTVVPS
jgi:hypothetical protein